MKTYIISFYHQDASEEELATYLDTKSEVLNWQTTFPNTIFVVSKRNAKYLSRLIEKQFPDSMFLVAEYNAQNSDGLLSEDMWEFLNNPEEA
jgi:hypothetical protein